MEIDQELLKPMTDAPFGAANPTRFSYPQRGTKDAEKAEICAHICAQLN